MSHSNLGPKAKGIAFQQRACERQPLVASVDTPVAHLAGAMGVETLVPLWHAAGWR